MRTHALRAPTRPLERPHALPVARAATSRAARKPFAWRVALANTQTRPVLQPAPCAKRALRQMLRRPVMPPPARHACPGSTRRRARRAADTAQQASTRLPVVLWCAPIVTQGTTAPRQG